MTVVDFLRARCAEELQQSSCSYELSPTGDQRCLCEQPRSETLELLAKASIVRRWGNDPDKHRLLRVLASEYASHPDYRLEWHPFV